MKRLILLLICALYVTTAAQAQISFYGEWCRKGGGEKTIMIFDMKEKKAYVMNEARKTCMVMEEIDKLSTNKLVGYDWEVSHSTSREFLGIEDRRYMQNFCRLWSGTTNAPYALQQEPARATLPQNLSRRQ